jgi:hypothetical protein
VYLAACGLVALAYALVAAFVRPADPLPASLLYDGIAVSAVVAILRGCAATTRPRRCPGTWWPPRSA